jgi:hypothetical protein
MPTTQANSGYDDNTRFISRKETILSAYSTKHAQITLGKVANKMVISR